MNSRGITRAAELKGGRPRHALVSRGRCLFSKTTARDATLAGREYSLLNLHDMPDLRLGSIGAQSGCSRHERHECM